MRGLAALAVVVFHLCTMTFSVLRDVPWLMEAARGGRYGVEVFFVISGFVLPYALHAVGYRIADFGRFLLRRIVRIEPPYLVSLALTIALGVLAARTPGYAGEPFRVSGTDVLVHLGYVNAFVGRPWLNMVYWTLALEFQFYVLLGLSYSLVFRNAFTFVAAASVLCTLAFVSSDRLFFYWSPVFLIGMTLFMWHVGRLRNPWAFGGLLGALGTVGLLVLGWPGMAAAGIAVVGFYAIRGSTRLLDHLGNVSYSLYLLHVPVGIKTVSLLGRWFTGPASVLAVAGGFVASLVSAYALYRWVEVPSMRLAQRIRYRTRAAAPAETLPAP